MRWRRNFHRHSTDDWNGWRVSAFVLWASDHFIVSIGRAANLLTCPHPPSSYWMLMLQPVIPTLPSDDEYNHLALSWYSASYLAPYLQMSGHDTGIPASMSPHQSLVGRYLPLSGWCCRWASHPSLLKILSALRRALLDLRGVSPSFIVSILKQLSWSALGFYLELPQPSVFVNHWGGARRRHHC